MKVLLTLFSLTIGTAAVIKTVELMNTAQRVLEAHLST
jgi:hypothetical protein